MFEANQLSAAYALLLLSGKTTVNSRYGTKVAVLAGDFLFAQSSYYLAHLDNLEASHQTRDRHCVIHLRLHMLVALTCMSAALQYDRDFFSQHSPKRRVRA